MEMRLKSLTYLLRDEITDTDVLDNISIRSYIYYALIVIAYS